MSAWKPTPEMPPALSFASQVVQYPATGPAGISYFAGEHPDGTVDCLLYRDQDGRLLGILNHYPTAFPPFEKAGAVNVFVEPNHYRRGIATMLVDEAHKRWHIDREAQRYTKLGAGFARRYHQKKGT